MWRVLVIAEPELVGLVGSRPQRGADVHGGKLALGALEDIGHAGLLVFLGQPGIESAAEIHVAGVTACCDHDTALGLDVQCAAWTTYGNPENLSGRARLADDALHLVAQQDLRALFPRTLLEPADEAGAVAATARGVDFARHVPLEGNEGARDRRGGLRADRTIIELDAVLDQEIEGCHVFVGKHAHEVAVAVLGDGCVMAHPILENLIGGILDAGLLLQGVAAAEMDSSAAQHAAAADVEILIDDDDGGPEIARRDGCWQPCHARAGDDHVRRKIPSGLGPGFICVDARKGSGAHTHRTLRQEGTPTH